MRHLIFALALLISASAAAQSPLADSTTWYVTPLFGYSYVSGGIQAGNVAVPSGHAVGGGLVVGRRVTQSVDLGFKLAVVDNQLVGKAVQAAFGPQIGVTRRIGDFDTHARVSGTAVVGEPAFDGAVSGLQSLGLQTTVTGSRSFQLTRGLRLAPTVGAYSSVCSSRNEGQVEGARCSEIGALAGVELGFRAFGADISMPFIAPIALAGNTWEADQATFAFQRAPVNGALRIRF